MRRRFNSRVWLRFVFSLFFIVVLSLVITLFITTLLMRLERLSFERPNPLAPIFFLLIVCMIISSLLTLFLGYRTFHPIHDVILASKQVAKGDFSVQLDEDLKPEEFRELNRSFNKMVKELSGIETLRSDFVANVSHEFKTPLAAIEGYASLLQDNTLTDAERQEYNQMILDSARQLTSLTGNILRLTKLDSQEFLPEMDYFSLDEQLRQALLLLEASWTVKNIDVDMTLDDVRFYGNEELLLQVWMNIFSNAVKFTPENGMITTVLTGNEKEVVVVISDTGIGIEPDVQKHIFDRFYQGDKSHSSEGNGLGLTLVKKIIDLYQGQIEIKSRPGHGTTFIITLPIQTGG